MGVTEHRGLIAKASGQRSDFEMAYYIFRHNKADDLDFFMSTYNLDRIANADIQLDSSIAEITNTGRIRVRQDYRSEIRQVTFAVTAKPVLEHGIIDPGKRQAYGRDRMAPLVDYGMFVLFIGALEEEIKIQIAKENDPLSFSDTMTGKIKSTNSVRLGDGRRLCALQGICTPN